MGYGPLSTLPLFVTPISFLHVDGMKTTRIILDWEHGREVVIVFVTLAVLVAVASQVRVKAVPEPVADFTSTVLVPKVRAIGGLGRARLRTSHREDDEKDSKQDVTFFFPI